MPNRLHLTDSDRASLSGVEGEGTRLAMSIVTRMAEVVEAPRLLHITAAHIDSSLYQGPATLEFAERLASGGARVRVPSTLNVSGVDPSGWREWAVPEDWAEPARRQMEAYEQMGCLPSWTCAPYQTEARPELGQQVAWGESSAIVFANSVLGARTERYPDLLDICCAVTGRAPAAGLHLEENRAGQILVDLSGIPEALGAEASFYPVLGHLVGRTVGDRIPVLDGLVAEPDEDDFKALGAAMASAGSVALFHWVGRTPEAADREAAFHGREPETKVRPTLAELRAARDDLGHGLVEADGLDLVVLGSPHFSLAEFATLATLVEGRRRHPSTRMLITTSRAVRQIAESAGHLSAVERFGAELTVDTCILTSPMLPEEIRRLMTNSAKYAYYTPGLLGRAIAFGSLTDCVESACAGRVLRDDGPWTS
ncbi:MAG: aconitase X catalytic domain-containing protein [Gemmatimonadota bacterium]|nr:aconitase X catalytic domain-containing protein [Gemmatimonadota bacterium]